MQIRFKLTLQFIAILASILFATFWYIYNQSKTQFQNEFFNTLRSKIYLTAGAAVAFAHNNGTVTATRESPIVSNENLLVYNSDNQLIMQLSKPVLQYPPELLNQIRAKSESRIINEHYAALGIAYSPIQGGQYIVVAESVYLEHDLNALLQMLILMYLGLLSLAAGIGWFMAGQALAPINRIMNQVESILPSDLSKRIKVADQKDELSRLGSTFNNLLARIEVAFNAQKLFMSNIAHELRNPLTVMNAQIEIALDKERTVQEYQKTLNAVREDVLDLSVTSSRLMQFAMLDSTAVDLKKEQLRIDELLWSVKRTVLGRQPKARIEFEIESLPPDENDLNFFANASLLTTALLNLIENAVKFSDPAPVKIILSFPADCRFCVCINDQGIGIPPAEMLHVFQPFYRASNAEQVRGSGVGLSLAKRIFDVHQIKVEIKENTPQGTIFQLKFSI